MTTFVLRLQPHEQAGASDVVLRGVVEEVATGHARTFRSATELLDVLTVTIAAGPAPETPS